MSDQFEQIAKQLINGSIPVVEAPLSFCAWVMENGKAHTKTLSELGFAKSKQARDAGFFCVKASHYPAPGRWMSVEILSSILPELVEESRRRALGREEAKKREIKRRARREERLRGVHKRLNLPEDTFPLFSEIFRNRPLLLLAKKHDGEIRSLWEAEYLSRSDQAVREALRAAYELSAKELKALSRVCPHPSQVGEVELEKLIEQMRVDRSAAVARQQECQKRGAKQAVRSPEKYSGKKRNRLRKVNSRLIRRLKMNCSKLEASVYEAEIKKLWMNRDSRYYACLANGEDEEALSYVRERAKEAIELYDRFESLLPDYVQKQGQGFKEFASKLRKRKLTSSLVEMMEDEKAGRQLAERIIEDILKSRKRVYEQSIQELPKVEKSAYVALQKAEDTELQQAESIYDIHKARGCLRGYIYGKVSAHAKDPRGWFPLARGIQREMLFCGGPTNSGKTHEALRQLKDAPTGVYLAPLRLLAHEVGEGLRSEGVAAAIQTGEERDIPQGATHWACTIETLDTSKIWDVAVIDEAQLISDPERGWAWVHAIIGVAARKVIILGSPSALPVIELMARLLNEPLNTMQFQRLCPLYALEEPTPIGRIQSQTAIVAFSRRSVIAIASHLRNKHGRKVSLLYGSLSPEVRRREAENFKEGKTDVIVSTDALGMGMNLPISQLLFWELEKFDGVRRRSLWSSEVIQIAGRSGRYGIHSAGYVGVVAEGSASLRSVNKALKSGGKDLSMALPVSLTPTLVAELAKRAGVSRLADLRNLKHPEPLHPWRLKVPSNYDAIAAMWPRKTNMPVETQAWVCHAPVNLRADSFIIREAIQALCEGTKFRFSLPQAGDLDYMERCWHRATLYLWLACRWPETFPDYALVAKHRADLDAGILKKLAKVNLVLRCQECSQPLPLAYPFRLCDSCYSRFIVFDS